MATLDETNIFQTPVTAQEPKRFSPEYFSQRQEQKAQEKAQYDALRASVKENFQAGNIEGAYENFTQLPVIDQMMLYTTPGLGNAIDAYEYDYLKKRSGRELKDPQAYQLELLMGGDPREVNPFTQKDPVSGAFSTLAGLSSLVGLGEIPSLVKGAMLPMMRRGMRAKVGDDMGGGGGGIGELVPQPKQDYAGYFSNVEKQALESMNMQDLKTGQDLINYLQSPKRSGISPKELDFIDFDQMPTNYPTKEEVIEYIQANRPQLYRVERREDSPTYIKDADNIFQQGIPFDQRLGQELNDLAKEKQANAYLETHQPSADQLDSAFAKYIEKANFTDNNPSNVMEGFISDDMMFDDDIVNGLQNYIDTNKELFTNTNGNPTDQFIAYKKDSLKPVGYFHADHVGEIRDMTEDGYLVKPYYKHTYEKGVDDQFAKEGETAIEYAARNRAMQTYGGDRRIKALDLPQGILSPSGNYRIVGSDDGGWSAYYSEKPFDNSLPNFGADEYYDGINDLPEAHNIIKDMARNNGDLKYSGDFLDEPTSDLELKKTIPQAAYKDNETLPTKYGNFDDFRLPTGGASNYREFTLHLDNPNTPTRFASREFKHFGGGDELLHYRVSDRIDTDGKKVLFVEEIQSDIHDTATSSTRKPTYEIGPLTKKQAVRELKDIFKNNKNLKVTDSGDLFKLDADSMFESDGLLSAQEVSNTLTFNNLTNFNANINSRKLGNLTDAEAKSLEEFRKKYAKDDSTLPDYPYKGNDWVELAVKDIMKLAAEGDYDRVAFTNAYEQIGRNRKRLDFIDEIGLQKIPNVDVYKASNQYQEDLARNKRIIYDDEQRYRGVSVSQPYIQEAFKKEYPTVDDFFAKNPDKLKKVEEHTLFDWERKNPEGEYAMTKKGFILKDDEMFLSEDKLKEISNERDSRLGAGVTVSPDINVLIQNLPEDIQSMILKDIEAGNIPTSIDDGQIYVLGKKAGSGKKAFDIYGQKIPQQLKKIGQKLDKDVDTQFSYVLYSTIEDIEDSMLYDAYKNRVGGDDQLMIENKMYKHKSPSIDITPKMKEQLLKGVNVMYKGGIVSKYKSMDKPIMGGTRDI